MGRRVSRRWSGRRGRRGPRRCRRRGARPEADPARGRRQPGDDVLHRHAVDLDHGFPGEQMGVGGDVGHRVHRRGRGLGLLGRGQDLVERALGAPRRHELVDVGPVGDPRLEVGEPGVALRPDQSEQPLGDGLRRRGDRHPATVGAAVGVAGHRVGDARAEAGLLVAEHPEGGDERSHQLEHRLEEVDVDHLPDAGVHRGHGGEGGHEGRDLVGEGDGRQQRAAVGLAVDAGEPGHGLGQGGEPRPLGVGAVLAEAGDPGDHQAGVLGDELVGHQPEGLELAGPEVLDEHVGGGDEAPEGLDADGVLEVEHHAALATAAQLPEEGDVVGRVAPPHRAEGVTRPRALDLDHVGAEVRQVTGAAGAGEHGGEVDDPEVGERRPAALDGHVGRWAGTAKQRSPRSPKL